MSKDISAAEVARAKHWVEQGRDQMIQGGVDEMMERLLWNYDASNTLIRAYVLIQIIDAAASQLSASVLDYPDAYGGFVGELMRGQRALLAELLELGDEAEEDAADARLYDERMAEVRGDASGDQ